MTGISAAPTSGNAAWSPWYRRFIGGLAIGVVAGVAVGAIVALSASAFLQRTVLTHDDSQRGERYSEIRGTHVEWFTGGGLREYCKLAAEAFYGHAMFDYTKGVAPRNEKAFYVACSGVSIGPNGG